MNETRVFLFEDHGQNEQHSVTNVEASEAAKLIEEGKAVELQLNDYDTLENQAKDAYNQYKKTERKIKQSDDPRMTEEVKQYELDNAYAELQQQTEALQKQWNEKRQELQAEARRKAARATVSVSQADKQMAEQLANRTQLNVMQASNPNQLASAIDQASQDIAYLSDSEKTALQAEISGVITAAERKAEQFGSKARTRTLLTAVQDVNNMDLLAGKVAEQLPDRIGKEYNRMRIVKQRKK